MSDLELEKKKTDILNEAYGNKSHMNKLVKYHLGEHPPQVASGYQRLYEDLPPDRNPYPKRIQKACWEAGDGFVPDRDSKLPPNLFSPKPRMSIDPPCNQTKSVNYLQERRYHVEKTQRTQGFKNIMCPPLYNKED